eukprot:CFRG5067T1
MPKRSRNDKKQSGKNGGDDARVTPSKILKSRKRGGTTLLEKASDLFQKKFHVDLNDAVREQFADEPDDISEIDDDECATCGLKGEVVICEKCPRVFHFACINIPLSAVDQDDTDWFCAVCRDDQAMQDSWQRLPHVWMGLSGETSWATLLKEDLKKNPVMFNYTDPRVHEWSKNKMPAKATVGAPKKLIQKTPGTALPSKQKAITTKQSPKQPVSVDKYEHNVSTNLHGVTLADRMDSHRLRIDQCGRHIAIKTEAKNKLLKSDVTTEQAEEYKKSAAELEEGAHLLVTSSRKLELDRQRRALECLPQDILDLFADFHRSRQS